MNDAIASRVEFPPIVDFMAKLSAIDRGSALRFNMVQAVPPYPTFAPIRKKLAEKMSDDGISFYTEVAGLRILREKIAELHPLSDISPDQIMVTAGANNAMFLAMKLLFNSTEQVGLLEPFYFNYDMALKMLDLAPVYIQLHAESGFQLKSSELISRLDPMSGLKGLILISPNNPTGAVYSPQEIYELVHWAEKRNVQIILDETYGSFDAGHLGDLRLSSYIGKNLHLVGSFSKSFSLTGYRVGYFISGKPQIEQAMKIQDTNIICASHIGQWAAYFGLSECLPEVKAKSEMFREYQITLTRMLADLKLFKLHSAGAFFAYLEHPFVDLSCEDAALRLYKETGVMGLPGTVFGRDQRAFLRLAFCNLSRSDLVQALEHIVDYDRRLASRQYI